MQCELISESKMETAEITTSAVNTLIQLDIVHNAMIKFGFGSSCPISPYFLGTNRPYEKHMHLLKKMVKSLHKQKIILKPEKDQLKRSLEDICELAKTVTKSPMSYEERVRDLAQQIVERGDSAQKAGMEFINLCISFASEYYSFFLV